MRDRLRFVLSLSFALVVPAEASASPVVDLAGSMAGNGGVQGVVSGPSAASTYFNPALLTESDEDGLLGLAIVSEQIGVTLDGRRGGADVPLAVAGRDIVYPNPSNPGQYIPIPNDSVPTQWLERGCPPGTTPGTCPPPGFSARPRQAQGTSGKTRAYLTLGLVKQLIRDRLSFGVYAMLPVSSFTTANAFYPDQREALFSNSLHPELYGDRLTSISIVVGAAVKIIPSLSIGAGLSFGVTNAATSETYVRDSSNYDLLLMNNAVTTKVNFSPTVGVRYQPLGWLRFGGAVHAPESFSIDTNVDATLPAGTQSSTERHDVFDWMPWMLAFGVEDDIVSRPAFTTSVAASVKYAFWSAYQDRHGQTPSMYGADLGWSNTLSGAIGVRQKFRDWRGFLDVLYVPSPVPEQVGASNYVDNDRLGLALGADVHLALGPVKFAPGLQLFGNRLLTRHNAKNDARIVDELPDKAVLGSSHDPVPGAQGLQTNNPGWPGFASRGWVWGGAVTAMVPL